MSVIAIAALVVVCGILVVLFIVVAARAGTTIPNPGVPLTPDQEARVLDAARGGNKIEAIKLHRQFTGSGLKEAKDAVEALMGG